jgi:hypothetical protein
MIISEPTFCLSQLPLSQIFLTRHYSVVEEIKLLGQLRGCD